MAIRHEITLSTTDPNNEIGLVKIRQADEETQTLVTQITENATPRSYEGLQVFFCAKLGQSLGLGIIEQKLNPSELTNPAEGKLEYTMRAEDWQQLGRQTGYFSFRKMTDDHTYTEQFSTRDFYYTVTKNVFSEGLTEVKKDGSTYVWTIEDLLRLFNQYIDSGKHDWEEFVEQNRDIIESVDPGGVVLNELIDARKPTNENPFGTLGQRLNAMDIFNTAVNERVEHVRLRRGPAQNSDSAITKVLDIGLTYAVSNELHYGNDLTPYNDDTRKNADGFFELDCSSFVHAVLNGVTYENSKFFNQENMGGFWKYDMPSRQWHENDQEERRLLAHEIGRWCYENGLTFEANEDFSNLQPGDLLFFENSPVEHFWRSIGHVGFWLGKTTPLTHYVLECGGKRNAELNDNPVGIHTYTDWQFSNQANVRLVARLPLQNLNSETRCISLNNLSGGSLLTTSEDLIEGKAYTLFLKTTGFARGIYPIIRINNKNIFSFGGGAEPDENGNYRAVFMIPKDTFGSASKRTINLLIPGATGMQKFDEFALYDGFVTDYPQNINKRLPKHKENVFMSTQEINPQSFVNVSFKDRIDLNVDENNYYKIITTRIDSDNSDSSYVLSSVQESGTVMIYNPSSTKRTVKVSCYLHQLKK